MSGFEKNDFLCSYAKNGETPKKLIETFYPDFVIIDIILPDMNGLELAKKIRENIKIKKIPIITGYQELDYKIKAAEADVNLYLTKPINPDSLINSEMKLIEKCKMEKYRFWSPLVNNIKDSSLF